MRIDKFLTLANRFAPGADGWQQLAPLGEHPGEGGVIQVIDPEACEAMVADFKARGEELLVDFDHLSFDLAQKSEAAAWIDGLETRPDGLYNHWRLTDLGEPAVTGDRYRYLSPVFDRASCDVLPGGRLRPRRLINAGLTNQPRLPNKPIANRDGDNQEVRMGAIAKALGLPEDADEAAILAAIDALKTQGNQAESQAAELKNRADALEMEKSEREAEAALVEFADVIHDREAVKSQLLTNRVGTVVVLKGLKRQAQNAHLPNRQNAALPDLSGADSAAEAKRAAAIRNRAAEIQAREGVPYSQAWNRASAEVGH